MSNNNDGRDIQLTLDLTLSEINIILEALGGLPFVRVFNLIQSIQTQAAGQLDTDSVDEAVPEEPHGAQT